MVVAAVAVLAAETVGAATVLAESLNAVVEAAVGTAPADK